MYSLLTLAIALSVATPVRADEIVPGRILIRYRAARPLPARLPFAGAELRGVRRIAEHTHVYELAGATADETRALAAELDRSPEVLYAEPDFVRMRTNAPTHPNDPMFQYQWALPMVRAPQAWSRTTGSSSVTVAIIDTGSLPHEDLQPRWVPGYDFITDPVNAADGDGRDADPTDLGTASESSSAQHGVPIAGIIGASSNNTLGVTGVDWACRLQPVRVLGVQHGTGVDSDIADAIRWSAGLHVDGVPDNATPSQVINMSFGGQGVSKTMQAAVDDAIAAGVVVVAAAGNLNVDVATTSPAGLRGVIAVGAVDPQGQLAPYSNWGASVALMAPGGLLTNDAQGNSQGVISTLSNNQYVYYAGTSQAAAFVSATVALMKAQSPDLTPADARRFLQQSADPTSKCASPDGSGGPGCGAGLLDVDGALVLLQAGGVALPGSEGPVVYGGCSTVAGAGGRARASAGLGIALLLLVLAVAAARRAV